MINRAHAIISSIAVVFLISCSTGESIDINKDLPLKTDILDGYWKLISPSVPEWAAGYVYINQNTFTLLSVSPILSATHGFPQSGFLYQPPRGGYHYSPFSIHNFAYDLSTDYDNRTGYYRYNNKEDKGSTVYIDASFYKWHLLVPPALPEKGQPSPKQAPTLFTFSALFISSYCTNEQSPPPTMNERAVNYRLQRLDSGQLYLSKIAATRLFDHAPDGPFGLDLDRTLGSLEGPFNGYYAPELIKVSPEQAPSLLRTYGDWKDQHPDSDTCDTPPDFPWFLGQTNAIRTHLGSPLLPLPEQR